VLRLRLAQTAPMTRYRLSVCSIDASRREEENKDVNVLEERHF